MAAIIDNNSKNYVFCPPPPGKPNPAQQPGKPLPRINQSGQKGQTCFIYAHLIILNEMRNNSGTDSSQGLALKKLSIYRKELQNANAAADPYWISKVYFEQLAAETDEIKVDSKLALQSYYPTLKSQINTPNLDALMIKVLNAFENAVNKFLAQQTCESFSTFCDKMIAQSDIEIHNHLLKALNLTEDEVEKAIDDYITELATFELETIKPPIPAHLFREKLEKTMKTLLENKSKPSNQMLYKRTIAHRLLSEQLGFMKSSWHPESPIKDLIEEIGQRGPLLITGFFGRRSGQNTLVRLTNRKSKPVFIEGRPLFHWKQNHSIEAESNNGHIVVVIGATIENNKGYVYYLDPVDGSNANDPSTQKVYVTSYQKLISTITNIDGAIPDSATITYAKKQDGPNNYACYLPR
jgi:hypothetical protein